MDFLRWQYGISQYNGVASVFNLNLSISNFHPTVKNLKYDRQMNFNTEITMPEANSRTEKKNFSTR